MGIGLDSWRKRIGSFASGFNSRQKTVHSTTPYTNSANQFSLFFKLCELNCSRNVIAFALIGMLLLCSGDVEVNPGPRTEKSQSQVKDDISVVLQQINANLTQLNQKVDQISSDMNILKTRMDYIEDNQNVFQTELAELRAKMIELELSNDKQESQSRRDNLLFFGVPESSGENWGESETKFRNLAKDMDIDPNNIIVQRCHRINTSSSPRPIIVKFLHFKDRQLIFHTAIKKLKSTPYRVSEDFSKRVREIRKKLWPHLKEAREQGKKAFLRFDKLIIEGDTYTWNQTQSTIKRAT